MIEIPIGIDANGNKVCVNIIELDPRFGTMTNKKLAAIQTEIMKNKRAQQFSNYFLRFILSLFLFRKITLNVLLKSVKIKILF